MVESQTELARRSDDVWGAEMILLRLAGIIKPLPYARTTSIFYGVFASKQCLIFFNLVRWLCPAQAKG
jgi:hypothetical protein